MKSIARAIPTTPALLAWLIVANGLTASTASVAGGVAEAPAPVAVAADIRPLQPTPRKPNGNAIDVRYRIDGVPEAGRPLPVTVVFAQVPATGQPSAWFTLDAGLAWPAGSAPDAVALVGGGETELQLTVVPQADGIGYINVFTRVGGVDGATAIAVRVGKAAPQLRRPGVLKSAPGERDKVISLPVP